MEHTGALKAALANMIKTLHSVEILFIPICVFVYGLISATAGTWEEYLAILPLVHIVCVSAGYVPDIITAGHALTPTEIGNDEYKHLYEVADGPDAFRRAARMQLEAGNDIIKVMVTGAFLREKCQTEKLRLAHRYRGPAPNQPSFVAGGRVADAGPILPEAGA